MWLFTRHGLLSVVMAKCHKTGKPLRGKVAIRARVKSHLVDVCRACPILRRARIIETPNADYHYRIVVRKSVWVAAATTLAMEVDYDNFKGEVAHSLGYQNDYTRLLSRVWHVGLWMLGTA